MDILKCNANKVTISQSFETFINGLIKGDILITKEFKWNKTQIEEIAVSLIKNFPIAPIHVIKDKSKLVILDGNQRAMALFLYYMSKSTINSFLLGADGNYDLSTIKEGEEFYWFEEADLTWRNLSNETKRYLKSRYVDVVIIEVNSEHKIEIYDVIGKWLNS